MKVAAALAALVTVAFVLAGCGGIRTYSDNSEKNLTIRTTTDDGSVFSKTRASLHVYSVDNQCKKAYEGTVKLSSRTVEIGLPAGSLSYLVFEFYSSAFLSNTSSSITQSTLLSPRVGAAYAANVRYKDDIYFVSMAETGANANSSRELDLIPFEACSPG